MKSETIFETIERLQDAAEIITIPKVGDQPKQTVHKLCLRCWSVNLLPNLRTGIVRFSRCSDDFQLFV